MTIQEQFQQAIANSKTLSEKPENETLLQLYALYKQSTEGDVTGEAPTGMFDFVAKAKYNAWAEIKGEDKEAAMKKYVELVTNLKG